MAASVIAVLGTLFGVGLTYVFMERGAARSEVSAREERLRQERMDAYCGYAGALVNYRRNLLYRWFCTHEQRPGEERNRAREQSYESRSVAQEELFRVRMLTDDPEFGGHAERALTVIDGMHHAEGRAELDRRRDATRSLIDDFVTAARPTVVPR